MKHFKFLLIPVMVFLLVGCQAEFDPEKEKADLLQTDRDFAAASLEYGAAEAFGRYMADDAMQMPAGAHPVFGREEIFKNMEGEYTLEWEPQDGDVSASGEIGWTWGQSKITWTDDNGEEQVSYGKYLNVWKRVEGQWKVEVDIGNKSPEPEPEPEMEAETE